MREIIFRGATILKQFSNAHVTLSYVPWVNWGRSGPPPGSRRHPNRPHPQTYHRCRTARVMEHVFSLCASVFHLHHQWRLRLRTWLSFLALSFLASLCGWDRIVWRDRKVWKVLEQDVCTPQYVLVRVCMHASKGRGTSYLPLPFGFASSSSGEASSSDLSLLSRFPLWLGRK